MECRDVLVARLSWALTLGGVAYLLQQTRVIARYGRYAEPDARVCSARLGWFVQEVPAFLLPLLLLLQASAAGTGDPTGRTLLLGTFMLHYFHRSVIYAWRTRGRPLPCAIVLLAAIFCSVNGFLQAHHLLHCARFPPGRGTQARMAAGLLVFFGGLAINIHSDVILRRLRRPGELLYKIPRGGMFEFVSGANFFGEIVEWCGFALAAGTFPAFAFAFFTICSIGPRAYHHHRDYQKRFEDYPRSRRALIPFIL